MASFAIVIVLSPIAVPLGELAEDGGFAAGLGNRERGGRGVRESHGPA